MHRFKQLFISLFYLQYTFSSANQGTISSDYGRIANIANENIYITASSSLTDCVRTCTEFSFQHFEYPSEDCYAYNYNLHTTTCELIHSIKPLNYIISFETKWKTGVKSSS